MSQATWTHSTKNGLILSNNQGLSQTMTVYGDISSISDSKYEQGKMDGTNSYFVVYSVPNYYDNPTAASTVSTVVDCQDTTRFGFNVKSAQGFDRNGITVFEHYYFCGNGKDYTESNSDITVNFPPNTIPGASSIIITKGWWSLYSQKNYQGLITINAGTRFGPGTRINGLGSVNDKVQSIKHFSTPTGN